MSNKFFFVGTKKLPAVVNPDLDQEVKGLWHVKRNSTKSTTNLMWVNGIFDPVCIVILL